MHGHKLHDLKHNEYSNRMVPNTKPNSDHVAIDTHRLVQHMLQVVEMAWTDDSTVAIFFYMHYQ